MTKYVLVKNLTCTESDECAQNILEELETLTGALLYSRAENDPIDGHVSIFHAPGAHRIWFFLYDTAGKHESESSGQDRIQDNPNVRRFAGARPNLNTVRDAITGRKP